MTVIAVDTRFDNLPPIRIGSEDHKRLFCDMLLRTFDPYKPAVIPWPTLSDEALHRLTTLPIWDIAVQTEGNASRRMQAAADGISDPLVREALSLNAFEERRHKEVLHRMIDFYGIKLQPEPRYRHPKDPEWMFLRTGYGECFDSFFSFGLFSMARRSGFFPDELVQVFEPVVQEEARHILFFVNWVAWRQANAGILEKPVFFSRRMGALGVKIWERVGTAQTMDRGNFDGNEKADGQAASGIADGLSPRTLFDECLIENNRRMARYDPRLLRPTLMPNLIRMARPFFKAKKAA